MQSLYYCLLSLGAEHSLSKRKVAGPIPAEGCIEKVNIKSLNMKLNLRKKFCFVAACNNENKLRNRASPSFFVSTDRFMLSANFSIRLFSV